MALTRRARRRLSLLVVVAMLFAIVLGIAWAGRQILRNRNASFAREEGLALWEKGDYESALPRLSTAVSRNKKDVNLLIAFADTRSKVSQPKGGHILNAVGIYRRALLLEPSNLEVLRGLLQLQIRAGMIAQLTDTAKSIRAIDNENSEALKVLKDVAVYRGRLGPIGSLEGTGDDDSALRWTNELIEIEPDVISHRFEKIALMKQIGRPDAEIIELANEWSNASENTDGKLDIVLAHTYLGMDQKAAAEESALSGLDKSLSDPTSLLIAIELFNQIGNQEKFNELMQVARVRSLTEPALARAMLMKPWRDGFASQTRDRLAEYADVLSDLPEDLLLLAQLYAAMGDVDQVRTYIEKLESLENTGKMDPKVAEEIDSWIVFLKAANEINASELSQAQLVELVQAVDSANASISIKEISSLILGDLYQRIGMNAFAIEYYRSAIDRTGVLHVVPAQRLVSSLIREGQVVDALPVSELLLRRHPNSPYAVSVWLRVRSALEREGILASELGAVIRPYKTSYELTQELLSNTDSNSQSMLMLVESALASGKNDAALEIFEVIIERDDVKETSLVTLSQFLANSDLLNNNPTPLEEIHDKLMENEASTNSLDAVLVLRTQQLRRLDRIEEAEALLEEQLGSRDDAKAVRIRKLEMIDNFVASDSKELPENVARLIDTDIGLQAWNSLLMKSIEINDVTLGIKIVDRIRVLFGENSRPAILAESDLMLGFSEDDQLNRESIRSVGKLVSALELQLDRAPNSTDLVFRQFRMLDLLSPQDSSASTELLLQIVNARPDAIEFYPPLISHLQIMGRYSDAQRYIQRFERSNTNISSDIRESVDYLRMFQGDPESALSAFKKSAEAPGASIQTKLRYVDYLIISMQSAEAERILEELMKDPMRPIGVDKQYAILLFRKDMESKALAVLQEAPGFSSELIRRLAIANMYLALDRPMEALSEIRADDEGIDSIYEAQYFAGRAYLNLGEIQTALVHLENAIELAQSEGARMQIATLMMMEPSLQQNAIGLLRSMLVTSENTGMVETVLLGAESAGDNGIFEPTDEQLEQSIALTQKYPGFKSAWTLAADFYVQAIKEVELRTQKLVMNNEELDYESLLKLRSLELQRTEILIDVLTKAANRFAADPTYPRMLSNIQFKLGKYDEALRFAKIADERSPGDRLVDALIQGSALVKLGRYASAVAVLQPYAGIIMEENRKLPAGSMYTPEYRNLLESLLRAGRVDEAAMVLDGSGSNPSQLNLWESIARDLKFVDAEKAVQILANYVDEDLAGDLRVVNVWTNVARRTSNSTALQNAHEGIEEIRGQLDPNAAGLVGSPLLAAHVEMSLASIQEISSIADARATYRSVMEMVPSAVRLRLLDGRAVSQQEMVEVRPWRKLLIYSLNNYAANSALLGNQLDSALDASNEAVAIASNAPELLDTRAMVHIAMANYDEASVDAIAASKLAPMNLNFKLTLAEAYAGGGNIGVALELLAEIERMNLLSDEPDADIREKSSVLRDQLLQRQAG